MPIVRFTRSVCKEIQKLSANHRNNVVEVTWALQNNDLGDCKELQGYKDVWRTRKGDTRVIWTRDSAEDIIVIKVDERDEDTYNNIPTDRRVENPELTAADFLGVEPAKFENLPTYEAPRDDSSMYQFFYGNYLYFPVLTEQQRKLLTNVQRLSRNSSLLVQGSPGTGKSVCATLIACQAYESYGQNVALILPKNLCQYIQKYNKVKEIKKSAEYNSVDFFIGTLDEWIKAKSPKLYDQIASTEEQMTAFTREASKVHIHNVSEYDLKLYISFIYGFDESVKNYSKRIIYTQNRKRIEEIRKIIKENFIKNLNGKILRIDALKKLAESLKPESVSDRVATVFIIDEAQDYLCKEIKLIHQILTNWTTQHGHPTLLWLLGDINQRIQPVDFEWSDLHLAPTFPLKYNYRSTANILRFANIFHQLAKKVNHEVNGALRHLPPISEPESAFEEGDKVKILIGNPQELLSRISQTMQNHRNTDTPREKPERYLLKELDQVPIVYLGDQLSQTVKYYTVEKVKGQEFDSCILVSSGNPKSVFSLTELNKWYTAITRPIERLLVIMTSEEVEQIGRDKLQTCCELFYNLGSLIKLLNWASESSNVEGSIKLADIDYIIDKITNQVPELYFDIYSALILMEVSDQKICEVESKLVSELKKYNPEVLEEQLEEFDSIKEVLDRVGLRCLVLRALGRSWDAVSEASRIKDSDHKFYKRLIYAIADDLEAKGLPFEAARVRARIEPLLLKQKNYPFADEFPVDSDAPLVSILCKLATSKIKGVIENEP